MAYKFFLNKPSKSSDNQFLSFMCWQWPITTLLLFLLLLRSDVAELNCSNISRFKGIVKNLHISTKSKAVEKLTLVYIMLLKKSIPCIASSPLLLLYRSVEVQDQLALK